MKTISISRLSLFALAVLTSSSATTTAAKSSASSAEIVIDAHAPATPFPHFWEEMFGSGRANLALRERYLSDLREVKKVTDFRYVRFHAIFLDDNGVYSEDKSGKPIYNFSYVDEIYDGLLKNGVRPCVEISFMPYKLSSNPKAIHPFWYKQNVAPPKDYAKWDDLIRHFAQHLIDRYGIDEVAQWYFEVWNEPNIDFWAGVPKQATYFELYDHTARALKSVSPRLRVGGPATAAADWVDAFLAHTEKEDVPVDFVSTHGYADDTVENLLHTHEDIPMDDRVCRAVAKVRGQIAASSRPHLPPFWTEWNVPSFGPLNARDTIYVGPALANTIRECDGLVNMMSFWTFSDVFEENGPLRQPFDGMFGLIALGGIKKPSYNAFALLHDLGDKRLANPSHNLLVTRRKDGTLVVAAWNLVDPDKEGSPLDLRLMFQGVSPEAKVLVSRLDSDHGNTLAAYRAMGSPIYPTQKQIAELNRAATIPPPETLRLRGGELDLTLPVNALYILEIPAR
jgi:xylan 1,4-beta-xylosidase